MRQFRFAAVLLLFAATAHADDVLITKGRETFVAQCSRCHGMEGKGDGIDAKRLTVQPRDLTSGRFKWKTTTQGTPPSDDDIKVGIIGHGLAGSGMPSFNNLSAEVKDGLVAYVKSISPAFQNASKPEPIPDPKNMKASPDLKKGAEVYAKLQCALCHGEGGRANGTSAFSLVDAWQRPIKPANLTQGWTYRGGDRPIDIYHRMLAGIDGAPMPSYEGAATHEEAWLLSQFVASLQLKTNFSKEIYASKVAGDLPADAEDAAWKQARRTDVNLNNFLYADGKRLPLTVHAVSVQALYGEAGAAFLLAWDDPTEDAGDAVSLVFRPKDFAGEPRGTLLTLYAPGEAPLNFNTWQGSDRDSVSRRTSNLAAAVNANFSGSSAPAKATYKDGHYTLVFRTDLPDETSRVGFAVWDGRNKESGLKFAGSEWLWLHLGEQTALHH